MEGATEFKSVLKRAKTMSSNLAKIGECIIETTFVLIGGGVKSIKLGISFLVAKVPEFMTSFA